MYKKRLDQSRGLGNSLYEFTIAILQYAQPSPANAPVWSWIAMFNNHSWLTTLNNIKIRRYKTETKQFIFENRKNQFVMRRKWILILTYSFSKRIPSYNPGCLLNTRMHEATFYYWWCSYVLGPSRLSVSSPRHSKSHLLWPGEREFQSYWK